MNDYRNFQRKSSRKKGRTYNKHCKGKQSLKQKNKYNIVISNKYRRLQQLQHARHMHNDSYIFFANRSISKHHVDIGISNHDPVDNKIEIDNELQASCYSSKAKKIMSEEQLNAINRNNGFERNNFDYNVYLRDISDSYTLQLNCDALKANMRNIKTLNILCVNTKYQSNKPKIPYSNSDCNMKDYNYGESILERMPCDVFLHCVCGKYLYPNQVFLLLSISKNIYKLITNGNYNYTHTNCNSNFNSNCKLKSQTKKKKMGFVVA